MAGRLRGACMIAALLMAISVIVAPAGSAGDQIEGSDANEAPAGAGSATGGLASAHQDHTCAVLFTGAIQCAGDNDTGQTGNGNNVDPQPDPVVVQGLGGTAVAVAAGDGHSCALLTSGVVKCWGENDDGESGNGNVITPQLAPVTAILGGTATAIAAGDDHTCALMTGGAVKCWGANDSGQTGSGNVLTPQLAPVTVALGGGAVTVAAGDTHTCAILTNGTLKCWGDNAGGKTGSGDEVSPQLAPVTVPLGAPAVAVSGGREPTCALLTDGRVRCWGANSSGETGSGDTASPQLVPVTVPLTDVAAIATGENTSCAMRTDGTVWCWGNNANGAAGAGSSVSSQLTPAQVPLGRPATLVTIGEDHSCASLNDGTVWCWGENNSGQIGIGAGALVDQYDPVQVPFARAVATAPAAPAGLAVPVTAGGAGSTLTVTFVEPVATVYESPIVTYTVAAGGGSITVDAAAGTVGSAAQTSVTLEGVDRSIAQVVTVTATNLAGLTSSDTIIAPALRSRIFVSNVIASGPAEYSFLFAGPGDQVVTGDWNANGRDGFASRAGNVFSLVDERGNSLGSAAFGKASDTVVIGDWNANGQDTFGVRRGNTYYLRNTPDSGNADVVLGFGKAADEVFVGDWNGNGQDTFAVRRGNVFYVRNSTTTGVADIVFGYGKAADEVLVGDWDTDGIDTFAVRRGNTIFIRNDFQTGIAEQTIGYGKATDQLLVGDFNADQIDTFAVRRLEPT